MKTTTKTIRRAAVVEEEEEAQEAQQALEEPEDEAQRSLARARAGYLRVGHLRGRRSRAEVQSCALRGSRILAGTARAVFLCPALAGPRDALAAAVGASALQVYRAPPCRRYSACHLVSRATARWCACWALSTLRFPSSGGRTKVVSRENPKSSSTGLSLRVEI